MRAIVVYESLWGNTEKVARAIAGALESTMSVDLMTSDQAPSDLALYDLVVVGGPTHAFSMSRPSTRESAVQNNGAPHAPTRGIREWIDGLPEMSRPIRAVAFDTRFDSPGLTGSAAKAARRDLRSLGFDVSTKAQSFRVHGMEGPLLEGELQRAANWASMLAPMTRAASRAPSSVASAD